MEDKQISYNGTTHSFPGDFSDDEISSALAEYDKSSAQTRGVGAEEGSGGLSTPGMEKLGGTPPAVGRPKLAMKKTMLIGGGSDAPDEQENESTGKSVANLGVGALRSAYGVSTPGIIQSLTGAKTPAMVKKVAPWVDPVPKEELAGEVAMQGGLAMVGALGEGGAELPTRALEGRAAAAAEPVATGAAKLAKSAPGPNVGLEIAKRLPVVGKYVRMADWGRKLLSPEPAAVPAPEVPAHWGQSNVGPVEMWGRSIPKGQERVTAGAPVARPAPAWQQAEAASKLQRAEPIPSNNTNGMKGGEEPPPSGPKGFTPEDAEEQGSFDPYDNSDVPWPVTDMGMSLTGKSMLRKALGFKRAGGMRVSEAEDNLVPTEGEQSPKKVAQYANMPADTMPPIDLTRLSHEGEKFNVITDGHHRTLAARLRGDKTMPANIYDIPTEGAEPVGGRGETLDDQGVEQRLEGQQESERAGADEIERKLFFMGNKPEGYTPKTLSLYDGQEKAIDVPLSKEESDAIYKGQRGGHGGAPPDEPTSGGGGGTGGEGHGGGSGSPGGNITPEPGQQSGAVSKLQRGPSDYNAEPSTIPVDITTPGGYSVKAFPLGGARTAGEIDASMLEADAKHVYEQLKGKPGFENLRIIKSGNQVYNVRWGEDADGTSASEQGKAYGYTDQDISAHDQLRKGLKQVSDYTQPEPDDKGAGGGIIDRLKKFDKDEEGSMALPGTDIFRRMKSGPMSSDTATPILHDMVKNSQAQRFFPQGLDGQYDPSDVLIDPEYKGMHRFSPDEIRSMTPVQEYLNPAIVNRYMDAIREGGDVSAASVFKRFDEMPDPRKANAAIEADKTLLQMQPDYEPHITEDLTGRRAILNGTHRSIASYKSDKPLDMSVYGESGELVPDSARPREIGDEGVPVSSPSSFTRELNEHNLGVSKLLKKKRSR